MTIKKLHGLGVPNTEIGRLLDASEGAIRYHVRRMAAGKEDGRRGQVQRAACLHEVIAQWHEDQGGAINLAALHELLVGDHGYEGSLRSVQRYCRRHFRAPRARARRRVETPPGAQGQVDWGVFPRVWIGGRQIRLHAFCAQLSHSRKDALVWSTGKDQLAWQAAHNRAFERLEGVPATMRVDNEKTAVSRGAGSWGEINASYRRYAQTLRFHIDACQPRSPEHKGKVERRIRYRRGSCDPTRRHWDCLEELQDWTDRRAMETAEQRICPATGRTVLESWEDEKRHLTPLPILPEPFDVAVQRPVGSDCLVHFEGRQYSVPFAHVGRTVEVRGCNGTVQVLCNCEVVADHPRHTERRLVIDATHFEGGATPTVLPPTPLGRMGRRLQQIADMVPEQRPVDMYAALAEVAR